MLAITTDTNCLISYLHRIPNMGWRETSPDIPTTIYILLTHLLILATVKTLGEWLDYTPIKMTKYKVLTFFLHAIKTSMRERENLG